MNQRSDCSDASGEHEPHDAPSVTESGLQRRLQSKAFGWIVAILGPALVLGVGKLYADAQDDRNRLTKLESVITFLADTQNEMRGDLKELLREIRK